MKKKLLSFIFCSSIFLSGKLLSQSTQSPSKYVRKYAALADSLSKEYDIPSSVILGVATIESANGSCRNSKLLNNHFGIVGKNNLRATHNISTMYKQYASVAESFADFCLLLTKKKFYDNLKGKLDYKSWVSAISKAGYSTLPKIWSKRVADAIEKNNLD